MDELTIELRGCFTGNTSDDMEVGDEDWDTGSLDGEYDFSAATTTTTSTTATEVIVATKEVLSEEEDLELLVVYRHSTGGGGDPQAESMLEEKRVRVSSNATLNHLLKKLKVAFDLPKIDESALELSDYDPVTQQVPHSLPPRWLYCNDALTWSHNGVTTRVMHIQQVGHPYRSWVTLSNRLRDEFIDSESAFLLEVPLLLSTHTHTHTHTHTGTQAHTSQHSLDCVFVGHRSSPKAPTCGFPTSTRTWPWYSSYSPSLPPAAAQFCSLPGACRSIDASQVLLVFEVLPTSSEGSTTEGTSARLPPPHLGSGDDAWRVGLTCLGCRRIAGSPVECEFSAPKKVFVQKQGTLLDLKQAIHRVLGDPLTPDKQRVIHSPSSWNTVWPCFVTTRGTTHTCAHTHTQATHAARCVCDFQKDLCESRDSTPLSTLYLFDKDKIYVEYCEDLSTPSPALTKLRGSFSFSSFASTPLTAPSTWITSSDSSSSSSSASSSSTASSWRPKEKGIQIRRRADRPLTQSSAEESQRDPIDPPPPLP